MVDDEADFSILAGEDLSFSNISGNRDDGLDDLIQRILHRSYKAVFHLATPCDPDLRTVVGNIASNIAADLEARLLMAAPFKGHAYNTRSKGRVNNPRDTVPANEPLDPYARDILKWTSKQSSTHLGADSAAPLFGSFMLFVAHHIKDHVRRHGEAGLFKPEDCRLLLPVANKGMKVERTDIDSADSDSSTDFYMPGYVNPTDFFSVECGMCPVVSSMEKQAAPAPHLIFAGAEMVGHPDDYTEAELRLATKTKALFFNQHNRRFAWGLAVSNRTIHAYVFGLDNIWASTAMDISGEKGRQAFISLLVNWSLCSIDRLGFDPSIRYVVDRCVGGPYLEIDVHGMDRSTGKVEPRTYYSQRCLGATDHLAGCHARYFAASTSPESMDKPAFLIKDVWMTTGSGPAGDTRESSVLNVLHTEFDKFSEFSDSFVQLVSAGPVFISQGDTIVADSTATAFAELPSTVQNVAKDSDNAQGSPSRCVRQHRRTVTKWTGNMISEADSESQVIVAVADTMVALNAVYVKCNILHGNISDRAILLQQTVDGIKGVLAEFDYASYAGDGAGAVEAPELMLFQSIRSLDNPRAIRTPLDDCESLLYLVCWLGTFGVNQAQRAAYAARHAAGFELHLPIKNWNQGTAAHIASYKRLHMATEAIFCDAIVSRMSEDEDSPLQNLAMDIYRVLFLHPGCYGTIWLSNRQFARVMDVDIRAALHEVPVINGKRDPLVLRYAFMAAILANLLGVLARHRDVALAALAADAANTEGGS
ncbi:hypothetical protein GGI03_002038 [Coemansia sp. RSA 2337]|nr:hypothetical protein GGH13_005127 [Coemansia sp. S155-1]KAJ2466568.1 hypothetical protein GGI03_002038 [Coemansia sp. RSA 2337]